VIAEATYARQNDGTIDVLRNLRARRVPGVTVVVRDDKRPTVCAAAAYPLESAHPELCRNAGQPLHDHRHIEHRRKARPAGTGRAAGSVSPGAVSRNGDVRRQCELSWIKEKRVGIRFLRPQPVEEEPVSHMHDALTRFTGQHPGGGDEQEPGLKP
jgi:hypothetical protein